MSTSYRQLPSVDKLLAHKLMRELTETYSREAVTDLVRACLGEAREAIPAGGGAPTLEELVDKVRCRANSLWQASPRRVINATGVIIHTNLGRSPLSRDALEAIRTAALGYSNLELDLATGGRGSRHTYLEPLLKQLTGAEAGFAVNNNASGVLLALTVLASAKEVVVSRGEAVEIGGGFRIPEVLQQSGATLVEVGTTNRTYASDYERALTERTAAILKVHTSNFRVLGFTHSPSLEELVDLGQRHQVAVLHDLGSGCLLKTSDLGLAPEPTPQEGVSAGADLLFFSGDKLLGGPQAGIIVGKKIYVERLKTHPLARAMRIDKLSLAGLVATLLHYVKDEAHEKIPVWSMLSGSVDRLQARAQRWAHALEGQATVIEGRSAVGGGSLPGETLPTALLAITEPKRRGQPKAAGLQRLAEKLRQYDPPIISRIEDDRLLLDPRTVLEEEDEVVITGLRWALNAD